MTRWVHSSSLRYALALWLATVTALLAAFVLQLEPAQWAAITVWIMFMQDPRLNYSKVIWWAFGTVVGAFMAVVLIACFKQTPELFLLSLALWLAGCASAAPLVTSYRAYGAVLAGYTCAIVSMSAVDHPDQVFQLAVTRVSCIFIGMSSAILFIFIFLPRHGHWRETVHHLGEHLKSALVETAGALAADTGHPSRFTWRHMADRLSTLEHTLDATTAETSDSRIRAAQARSLVATLFCLLAKAQAIGIHLSRPGSPAQPADVENLLARSRSLFATVGEKISPHISAEQIAAVCGEIELLNANVAKLRQTGPATTTDETLSTRFILDRLDEILDELSLALNDWSGLFGTWTARRATCLSVHRDYMTAFIYGLRMFFAIGTASALWFITEWPSGSQFILFIAVVCSLLSLQEYAPSMGLAFIKSAIFCAVMACVTTFSTLQAGSGFLILTLALGIFLIPAAYAYRHPRLIGSAVVSMLVFYGLTMPANQMNYDISAFLNNGIALLCATVCGFFSFHAVPSLSPAAKRSGLLRAIHNDLGRPVSGHGPLTEQDWTSRTFDRLRLLHRTVENGDAPQTGGFPGWENEVLLSLQLGLRQRRLNALIHDSQARPEVRAGISKALRSFRKISRRPDTVADRLRTTFSRLTDSATIRAQPPSENDLGALAELREMTLLLETNMPLYAA